MTSRRTFLATAAFAGAAPWAWPVRAQASYPSKPVKMVVPYAPGGAVDLVGRLIATELGKLWSQPVVVENRPGAGGSIGTAYAAKADPDGYTILSGGAGPNAVNPALYENIGYDPVQDFTPLTMVGTLANILLANKDFPADDVPALIEAARTEPDAYSYGSPGNGTSPHLAGELFCQMTGVKLQHIPYKGSANALNDLLGGQIGLAFDNLTAGLPFVKDGKLKAIAVTTSSRSPLLPDLPTIAESGVPGYDMASWSGIFAPANLPPDVARKLSQDIGTILQKPEVVDKLLTLGILANPNTPEAFGAFVADEVAKFRELAEKADLSMG